MALIDLIKKAGVGAVDASNPVSVVFGTVTQTDPLEVNVDQRFVLTEGFLIVPERLTRHEADLSHTHEFEDDNGASVVTKPTGKALSNKLVLREGLQAGDRVLLLRVQGGQQFVVLDKVVA
ncbi:MULTISPECIES: DUF2577 domain-containing protein [unclassified Paenibacillus]|uniref:DUF2577 domain-containing protein n=1 Tax=unclassified Paenibacillus TaxID=185978 RepID=UPI001C12077A|nr:MULTISPECIES: DUF2577 domain-containing protein [unclassified Paenibacillus]MBU5445188.1 DUF2577 domain-containing protein [Paenibacillus sp. MSJ-34]CAH0122422.1 hypothetical protein PAE9249_04972 [Paenibacillus sp. CECT 9249]